MAGAGALMIFAAIAGFILNRRKKLHTSKWYLRGMIALIAFPFIANSAGWIMTEIGRQPWTVMGQMTTAQSVSPNVTTGSLLFSIIGFGVMYLILGASLVFLFVREIKKVRTMMIIRMFLYQRIRSVRRFTMGSLHDLWFVLVSVLFVGFFFLEGFDFGVGISTRFLGHNELERRVLINTIGPFWDANEVWSLTGTGAIFAAFPNWYATMLSGYYIPFIIILLALMGRGVAFEFRGKVNHLKWVKTWDWVIFFGDFIPPFVFGLIFTSLFRGMPIDGHMNMHAGFSDIVNVYSVLGGAAVTLLSFLHGLMFVTLRTIGDLQERARKMAKRVIGVIFLVVLAFFAMSAYDTDMFTRRANITIPVFVLIVICNVLAVVFMSKKKTAGHSV